MGGESSQGAFRLRCEVLTGCVRPELWGGGRNSRLWQAPPGAKLRAGAGERLAALSGTCRSQGWRQSTTEPPNSCQTWDKGERCGECSPGLRVGDSRRWKVTQAWVSLGGLGRKLISGRPQTQAYTRIIRISSLNRGTLVTSPPPQIYYSAWVFISSQPSI